MKQYPAMVKEYSPTWLLQHRPPPRVHLLVMSSNTDPQSYPQTRQFLRLMQNSPGVQPYLVQNLGHSLDTYQAVLVPILNWMASVADL